MGAGQASRCAACSPTLSHVPPNSYQRGNRRENSQPGRASLCTSHAKVIPRSTGKWITLIFHLTQVQSCPQIWNAFGLGAQEMGLFPALMCVAVGGCGRLAFPGRLRIPASGPSLPSAPLRRSCLPLVSQKGGRPCPDVCGFPESGTGPGGAEGASEHLPRESVGSRGTLPRAAVSGATG